MKKKFISFVLMLAITISIIPSTAFAAPGGSVILEVCSDEAYIRKSASQDAKTLHTARKGAILSCTGSTVNKHGNVWFSVECIDANSGNLTTGWVYSERVREHTHSFTNAGDGLTFCRCGMVSHSSSGNVQMGYPAVLDPGALIGLGAAIDALKNLGLSVAAGIPYVSVAVAIGGIIYMAYVSASLYSTELLDLERVISDYAPKDYSDGKYYYAGIFRNGDITAAFLVPTTSLNYNEALSYMTSVCRREYVVNAFLDKQMVSFASLYTPNPNDAVRLCDGLEKTGEFSYGDDSMANHQCDFNKRNLTRGVLYYEHFHIYARPALSATSLYSEKVKDTHVFFGIPYTGYSA